MTKLGRKVLEFRHREEILPVPIVSDAAIATEPIADGRMIPVLILDTSRRPDIEDMIAAHRLVGPGDVESSWGPKSRFDKSSVRLILNIWRPSVCLIALEFDVVRSGGVVDLIVEAQGLYLQAGRVGDRLKSTFKHERVLVEIPSREFKEAWNRIFLKGLAKSFRDRGLSRSRAKRAAASLRSEWRQFFGHRVGSKG